jgi:septum formation protein
MVLASASPRRAALLAEIGIVFEVVPGQVNEIPREYLSPGELARFYARKKAREAAIRLPDRLVLGADTVVCLENRVFGKPANMAEARACLTLLQGRSHQVITGVCLLCHRSHCERLFAVGTTVRFRPLTSRQIDGYLKKINPLDKAGAYAIQEYGEMIVEEIAGSYSNVVGLPVERLQEELSALGWSQPKQAPKSTCAAVRNQPFAATLQSQVAL